MAHVVFFLVLVVAVPAAVRPQPADFARTQGGLQADEKKSQASVEGDTSKFEIVGACRANCVEQTRPMEYPPTYDGCSADPECTKCWNLCEQLFLDEMRFRPICDNATKSIGCITACEFSFTSVLMPKTMPWKFEATPTTTEVSDEVLHLSWEIPHLRSDSGVKETTPTERPFLVYSLLFRDDSNPHWSLVIQTLDTMTRVTGPHSQFPGLQFLLLVSSSLGTVARDIPPYPVVDSTITPSVTPIQRTPATTPHQAPNNKEDVPATAKKLIATMSTVSVFVGTVSGRLEVILSWHQEINIDDKPRYTVRWGRQSCNVDTGMPHCPLTDENIMETNIPAKDKKEMRLTLSGISFNSKYWLDVGFDGTGESLKTFFYTPSCPTVDASFAYCLPLHTPATTRSTTMVPSSPITTGSTSTIAVDAEALIHMWKALVAPKQFNLNLQVGLLSFAVTLCTGCIVTVAILIYKRRSNRLDPTLELARVLQSTSHLPLLGLTPRGSMASLHRLQCHNALLQSPVNGSPYVTPPRLRTTPTIVVSPPVKMNLQPNPPSTQPWPLSVDTNNASQHMTTCTHNAIIEQNSLSPATPPPVSASVMKQQQHHLHLQQLQQQEQPRVHNLQSSKSRSKTRSMEGLKMGNDFQGPVVSASSVVISDLSPKQPARRSTIDFHSDLCTESTQASGMGADPFLGEECDEVESGPKLQSPCTSIKYLLSAPEESDLMLGHERDHHIEGEQL